VVSLNLADLVVIA